MKSVKADGESGIEVALLDGGATHALRQAKPSELGDLRPVEVEMAVGKVTLHKVPYHDTLLSLEPVEPIIPLRVLVDEGFTITWSRNGCEIEHPRYAKLACTCQQGCPVMVRSEALNTRALEQKKGVTHPYEPTPRELDWWRERFP